MRAGVYGRQSQGHEKSISDQIEIGAEVVGEQGWSLAGKYRDAVSASRYGAKTRGDWERLRTDIRSGKLDVVVLWESSRGTRDAEVWLGFLRELRDAHCSLHVTSHERTYNLSNARDWKTLAQEGIESESEANLISLRARRGTERAARNGRPSAGVCPYGYRRLYDPNSGKLLGQEPDPETVPIVVEIVRRVAKRESIHVIAADLNERGIVPPGKASRSAHTSARWYRQRVRDIALNRVYLGERKHKGEWHPASWAPIVDPETFALAARVLSAPGRSRFGPNSRPGKQKWLLTYYAECPRCGRTMRHRKGSYTCAEGCVSIKREPVDGLIEELAIERLSSPDLYAALEQAADAADTRLMEARGEAAALRQRLDEFRVKAFGGGLSVDTLALAEAELLPRIAAAEARAEATTIPADLAGWVGPAADVKARWAVATVQARRAVLRAIGLRVEILPSGGKRLPVHERVAVSWAGENGH
jgi:site-specific DNA recombinase